MKTFAYLYDTGIESFFARNRKSADRKAHTFQREIKSVCCEFLGIHYVDM